MAEQEKKRYSDEELEEFRQLILEKLKVARENYEMYMKILNREQENITEDDGFVFKGIDEDYVGISRQDAAMLAQRQLEYIRKLEAALVRIENKTYGICRKTGKLISKERLRAVPHATLSIEAKMKRNIYGD
jgi:RNA polymerase-binding transcription factor DksA